MKYLKFIFCSFAAVWLPIMMFTRFLEITSLLKLTEILGDIPLYAALVGSVLMLIDLWQSSKTQDQKIWWTVLGAMFFPVVAPAYWFGYGLKNLTPSQNQAIDSTETSSLDS